MGFILVNKHLTVLLKPLSLLISIWTFLGIKKAGSQPFIGSLRLAFALFEKYIVFVGSSVPGLLRLCPCL